MDRNTIAQMIAELNARLGQTDAREINEVVLLATTGSITTEQQALLEERSWWRKAALALADHAHAVDNAEVYRRHRQA